MDVVTFFVAGALHIANENSTAVRVFPAQQRDLFLSPSLKQGDNLSHRYGGGPMITYATKVHHQTIKFVERWSAISFHALSYQSETS